MVTNRTDPARLEAARVLADACPGIKDRAVLAQLIAADKRVFRTAWRTAVRHGDRDTVLAARDVLHPTGW